MIEIIKAEFKRRMQEESLARILQCIHLLGDDGLWYAPNKNVNSIGNLVLHLSGNITQYIHTTFGSQEDQRNRALEFSSNKTHSKEQLIKAIKESILKAVQFVEHSESSYFEKIHEVQCFRESGLSILIHVIEHTSYHTGQITQMTKWINNIDTGYYSGLELDKTVN